MVPFFNDSGMPRPRMQRLCRIAAATLLFVPL